MADPRPWVEIELLASGTELIQRRRNLGLERLVLLQRQKQKQREAADQTGLTTSASAFLASPREMTSEEEEDFRSASALAFKRLQRE